MGEARRRKQARRQAVICRPATPADRGFIAELAAQSLAEFSPPGTNFAEWLDEPAVITTVAEQNGMPIGFVMDGAVADGDRWVPGRPLPPAGSRLYVDGLALAVNPRGRRHGVGEKLLRCSRAVACRLGALRIETSVAAHNVPMRRMLQRLGFRDLRVEAPLFVAWRSVRMVNQLALPDELRAVGEVGG